MVVARALRTSLSRAAQHSWASRGLKTLSIDWGGAGAPLPGEDAHKLVADALVLAEHEAHLARAHADVARRDIRELACGRKEGMLHSIAADPADDACSQLWLPAH